MLYLFLAILATTIGSMAGIGGGVILKPLLDFATEFDVRTISTLSAITILSMAIVSSIKYSNSNIKIQFRQTALLGFGSIIGGIFGEKVLSFLLSFMQETTISIIQNFFLVILMILVYLYMKNKQKLPNFKIKNPFICILSGFFLGIISAILSIGGGPINVCVLAFLFSMDTKEAAVNSIIIILLSQASKLTFIFIKGEFPPLEINIVFLMILGGILGGIVGSNLNKRLTSNEITLVFNTCIISLMLLNAFNIYTLSFNSEIVEHFKSYFLFK